MVYVMPSSTSSIKKIRNLMVKDINKNHSSKVNETLIKENKKSGLSEAFRRNYFFPASISN